MNKNWQGWKRANFHKCQCGATIPKRVRLCLRCSTIRGLKMSGAVAAGKPTN